MGEKKSFLRHFDMQSAIFPEQGKARAEIHNGLEFPTTRDENWKYTRIAPILDSPYQHNPTDERTDVHFLPGQMGAYKLVFINGRYSEKLSDNNLPNGLKVASIGNAGGGLKTEFLTHLKESKTTRSEAFHTLNTAYFTDGAILKVEDGVKLDKPVALIHVVKGNRQATNLRNLILLGKNTHASVLSQFEHESAQYGFTNVVTEVKADEGANGAFYILQNEGDDASQVNAMDVSQEKDSKITVVTVTKSGGLVRNNLRFNINGQGCESNMFGLYFTSGNQHVDNHTFVDHRVPNCNSNELYKGVMNDKSSAVFNGKIMVRKDAQKTNAFQSNQNILLSDRATVNTKPELEIYADDVKCSHGCTVGQLDSEAVFYLQSRGIGEEDAKKLLVRAFAAEVIAQIDNEALREDIFKFIAQKFELKNA